MRRLIVIALLLLLPLQASWATAARYCGHESAAVPAPASHPGHHDHQHDGDERQPAQDSTKAPGVEDADCGLCHLGCGAGFASEVAARSLPSAAAEFRYARAFRSHIPPGPERPDRRLAA